MLNLKNVELICIDGRTEDSWLDASVKALLHSCNDIEFNSVKLISPVDPKKHTGYTHYEMPAINAIEEYSKFMIKDFYKYIESDFCLLVQWDGFIINPQLWDNNFLNYDYIGAPWPKEWEKIMDRPSRVGNGGFSLRSKKIMETVSKFEYNLQYNSTADRTEDNFICLQNFHLLQTMGIKFAPVELASKFSFENPTEENSIDNTFGFHGRHPLVHKYLQKLYV